MKKKSLLFVLPLMAMSVAGCTPTPVNPPKPEPTPVVKTLVSISASGARTNYTAGESFDKSGLVVKAKYSDGTESAITNYTASPEGALAVGNTKVTVSYTEGSVTKTVDIAITVSAPQPGKEIKSLALEGDMSNKSYVVGDAWNPAGLSLVATYVDDTTETVDPSAYQFIFSPEAPAVGTTSVNVTAKLYAGAELSASKTIEGIEVKDPSTKSSLQIAWEAGYEIGKEHTAEKLEFTGTCTGFQGNHFFLQDGEYAIMVRFADGTGIEVGKKVTVKAHLTNYFEQVESWSAADDPDTTPEIVSIESGTPISAKVVASLEALGSERLNNLVSAESLTVISVDSVYAKGSTDGKVSVKFANEADENKFILIINKAAKNETAGSVMASLVAGDTISVSNAFAAAFNKAPQMSLLNESVVTKGDTPTPTKEIVSIAVQGDMSKKEYKVGESWSSQGLSVLATYDDESTGVLDSKLYEFSFEPAAPALQTTSVAVKARLLSSQQLESEPVTITGITVKEPVVGEDIVYTFKNGQDKIINFSTFEKDEDFLSHVVVDGEQIITGYKDATNSYIGGNGGKDDTAWNIWDSLKVGKSKAKGSVTLKLDSSVSFESIKLDVIGARDDGELTINNITKPVTKKATKDDLEPIQLEYDISSGISDLVISSKDMSSDNYSIVITRIEFVTGSEPVAPKLSSISISEQHREFTVGDEFVKETVTAHYTGGKEDVNVTDSAEFGEVDMSTAGKKTVSVSYTEDGITKNTSYEINVKEAPVPELESLTLTTPPTKGEYVAGESFDPTGAVITANYTLGKESANVTSSCTFAPSGALATSDTKVVASYTEGGVTKTVEIAVTVNPAPVPTLESLTLTTPPTKGEYVAGESFDPTGAVITANYTLGKESANVTSSCTFAPSGALATSDTKVVASYEEGGIIKTVDIAIEVKDPQPEKSSLQIAYEAGAALTSGHTDLMEFTGVVTGLQGTSYFLQDGDYTIEVYNCATADVVVGKKLTVKAHIQNYKGLIETWFDSKDASTKPVITKVEDGTVVTPAAISSKTALDATRLSNLISAESLTVVSKDSSWANKSADGKVTLKIGEDTETVTLIMSKYCTSAETGALLNGLVAGDEVSVSKAIVAQYNSVKQISLLDDTVLSKKEAPVKEIKSIAIEGDMTNKSYSVGSDWNPAGLSVVATYEGGSTAPLDSSLYELSYDPAKANATTVTSVVVTATLKAGGVDPATKTITGITVSGETKVYSHVTSISDIETGTYIISAKVGDNYYGIASAITLTSNKIKNCETVNVSSSGTVSSTDGAAFALTITVNEDSIYIKDSNNKYLGYSSSTNLSLSDNPYEWCLAEGVNGTIRIVSKATNTRALSYRAGDQNCFGPYSTSNITATSTEYFDLELFKA